MKHVGTAASGCPVERSSTALNLQPTHEVKYLLWQAAEVCRNFGSLNRIVKSFSYSRQHLLKIFRQL